MSVDHHKYGLAPKGISVVLYRHKSLRKYQYFSKFNWSGGIYVTPGVCGTRSAGPIAGAWFAMCYLGYHLYDSNLVTRS